jgi:hypothetical protein
MEAICQPGYYVRRRAWAVFPKSDAKRGQPSSGRWRQENAAGEAAERISALSGIGAGMITYESMAMAAGEDDADKFKSGGVLTCSASVQDSGEDRLTNTCGAYDVNHLKCVHGGVRAAAAAVTKTWHRLAGNQMIRVETCIQRMAETVERSVGLSKCLCLSVMGCSAPC